MSTRCTVCGCEGDRPGDAHVQAAALANGDLDRALALGLLDAQPCGGCSAPCNRARLAARDARHGALAARERYRARIERLERQARARAAARTGMAPSSPAGAAASSGTDAVIPPAAGALPPPDARPAPMLPPSVAAVLARAKQRANRHDPT